MSLRKKKLAMYSLESPTESDDESGSTGLQVGITDSRLSGLFDRINLQAAVEQLPGGYKAMFILHDVNGYAHNQIAKMVGCSAGNSKSQLHKARKRLREVLRGLDLAPNKSGLLRRRNQDRSDGSLGI
jgi:RNA polymerase sigma-70 factor, ECF subfamily